MWYDGQLGLFAARVQLSSLGSAVRARWIGCNGRLRLDVVAGR